MKRAAITTKPEAFPAAWPMPADEPAGALLLERFAEQGRDHARLVRDPGFAAMLRCLGGNAPYLADLALREAATMRDIARLGVDAVMARCMAELAAIRPWAPRAEVAAAMRAAKRRVALGVAIADIGGLWTLEQVVAAISDLADATLSLAVAHLLRAAHDSGTLHLPHPDDPGRASGFTVLGMGKLGARELNYSSDVDLILIHDPDSGVYDGDEPVAFFTRIARGLVNLMEARDSDGYVFRTDLRLRPDPAATPPSVAIQGAIGYYASMGQNWERAAMLKARPVAGDLVMGLQFLQEIRPFIWRRHLDFAAVADIHAMKRRIDDHRGSALTASADPVARVLGHNVKLGQGGIREIEFLAQTLQLVWGGRDPGLRTPRTLEALRALVRAGHLPRATATALAQAYVFLRNVEHRLQMVADRQTQELPQSEATLAAFALFMGFPTAAAFAVALLRHLSRVQDGYAALFEMVPDIGDEAGLDFSGIDAPQATLAALSAMGFQSPAAVVASVRGWKAGRLRALRSQRAQELMDQLLPGLLDAIARQGQPDAAFARLDALLGRLPAGVQLLSLLQRNPGLLERIAAVLGAAPSLADHLARTPGALEGLLMPEGPADPASVIRSRLSDARTVEDAIAIIRTAVREEDFAVSVATMEGRLDADAAGLARATLADAALSALLPWVLDDFAIRNGQVRGGAMAVVLLGKAGGREMMAGSDLDLMVIYDHPATAQDSTGRVGSRRLPPSQWFIRAVHAYVAAMTAPDAGGPMYAVDMRLRPSGNKGPVAVSLQAFERYHAESVPGDASQSGAWTWERMALTRARVVAGPPRLRARINAALRAAQSAGGPPERIAADAAAMRARLLRDLPPSGPWDVKLKHGGQIDVEFIAQALMLMHVRQHPDLVSPTTRIALAHLRNAGVLPAADAALLIRADRIWRTVQGVLRIAAGRNPAERLPPPAGEALLRAVRAAGMIGLEIDMPGLQATLQELAAQVVAAFRTYVGEPKP
jgi:glutamate-ammonia-ligase adenylyltransferase